MPDRIVQPTLTEPPMHRPRPAACGHLTTDEVNGRCRRCRTDPAVIPAAERADAARRAYRLHVFGTWAARHEP